MLGSEWMKSSRSGGNGNSNCVEVRAVDTVQVRDTKDRDGGTLAITPEAWTRFVRSL